MENNSIQQQNNFEEEEIDIIAIILRLWEKKWFIIKVTCVFAVLGVFVAIFSPKEYTASCVVVPETKGGAFSSSSLGGLAAIAGINLGASSSSDMLSPIMYDKLLNNINLRKELMQTPINWEGYEEPITILDYYTNPKYAKVSVLDLIKKYTLGLPSVILNAFKGKHKESNNLIIPFESHRINVYTKDEYNCIKKISNKFSISVDVKTGDISINARMPEAVASAQIVDALKNLLQKYVIELKLQKAEVNYEYIKQRYNEVRVVFEQKQEDYAKFQDANKVLSSALSKAKEEQIRSEFTVAKNLFNELTTQLVQAEMKVKEDIPVLSVVEPVQVPLERSKPQRAKILFFWSFIGAIFACGLILVYDWITIHNKKLLFFKRII